MSDSYDKISFRTGWQPTGRSRDVTLSFQRHTSDFVVPHNVLYYFKPVDDFTVADLSDDMKFEEIDFYIVNEFGCDWDDVITIDTSRFGPVIVMSEKALLNAGVKLPRWSESPRRAARRTTRLALVPS